MQAVIASALALVFLTSVSIAQAASFALSSGSISAMEFDNAGSVGDPPPLVLTPAMSSGSVTASVSGMYMGSSFSGSTAISAALSSELLTVSTNATAGGTILAEPTGQGNFDIFFTLDTATLLDISDTADGGAEGVGVKLYEGGSVVATPGSNSDTQLFLPPGSFEFKGFSSTNFGGSDSYAIAILPEPTTLAIAMPLAYLALRRSRSPRRLTIT